MVSHQSRLSRDGERGQAVVIVVVMMFVLLGMGALVIDVGYAYYTQRSLQASADAAALAGAQELPDASEAEVVAREYSGAEGAKNARDNVADVTTAVTTKCITSIPGCDPASPGEVNAVVVTESAPTKTFFAGLFGIDKLTVKARSTACSPCGVKPLDMMVVLDRTGSMCQTSTGAWDLSCTDLNNARAGIKTFLGFLDPKTQWVGLVVLPPAPSKSARCTTPSYSSTAYNSTLAYTAVSLSDDYSKGGQLDASSNLVSTLNCVKGGGYTAYANGLEKAQAELELNGRPDVKDVIIFLSDGAANMGPSDYPASSPYRKQPCRQGVNSAAAIKAKGTVIYSIGYDLNALDGGANECKSNSYNGPDESPPITAYQAIQGIASPGGFFDQPSPGELRTVFTEIAADLARGYSALIDDSAE